MESSGLVLILGLPFTVVRLRASDLPSLGLSLLMCKGQLDRAQGNYKGKPLLPPGLSLRPLKRV